MIVPAIAAAFLTAASVSADAASRSVSISAKATGITENAPVEFLLVGPDSDRDYESVFVTELSADEIAKAFEKAGIPRGTSINERACRFWPAGCRVSVEPSPWNYVSDCEGQDGLLPVTYTGGERDAYGTPAAATNMPAAVFAFYSLAQSMLLLDDALDQSETYGRFKAGRTLEKGTRVVFTVTWDGFSGTRPFALNLKSGNLKESIEAMRAMADDADGLEVTPSFDADMTLREAVSAAKAVSVLDSRKVKVNGFREGQFFYRAFLPLEKWRDRSERLTQPLEVYMSSSNTTFVVIDEDWSVEGLEPKRTPRTVDLTEARGAHADTCFIYAPPDTKLSRLYDFKHSFPATFRNWYLYCEQD